LSSSSFGQADPGIDQAELDVRGEQQHLGAMPKRKEPELTPAEQYKRFKEAAKKAGVTKDEEEFERAFEGVARPKRSAKK
jgi:protein-arginine kinase activator protein McsA